MTKMIPTFPSEAVYGAVTETQAIQSAYSCVDCLLGGIEQPLDRPYWVGGTVLCAGHAITARKKELQL